VSLPVDRLRRFFVWGFGKAEDLARLLVVLVPVILDPVFVLYFEVLLVGLGHRLCGQPFHAPVVVHEEWHSTDSPFSAFPGGLWLQSCIVEPWEAEHMSQMHYFCLLGGMLGPKARE